MKVRPSVKKMCDKCKIIVKRRGVVECIAPPPNINRDKDKQWRELLV